MEQYRVRRMIIGLAAAITTAGCLASAAWSQPFPSKPIRIIVPYATGGVVDASARMVGTAISESVGVPVLVENRPGGSTIPGMLACGKAPPDGHTTCMTVADSLSYNPFLFKRLPYDAEKDFVPVINLVRSNSMLLASAKAPFNSIKEMIAYARSRPGLINFGTWGPASIPDLYLLWMRHETGIDITAVPYKGVGQAAPALLAGEIDVTFATIGGMISHIKAGRLKSLAVAGNRRFSALPDVPALAEEGVDPGLRSYFGVFAPGGTPRAIADRLNAEFSRALQIPRIQEFFRAQTLDIVGGSAQEFAEFLKADRANAARVFKALGVVPTDSPS
jgi:tripartite-type tricarboxylate transporter receptor subunit TctC